MTTDLFNPTATMLPSIPLNIAHLARAVLPQATNVSALALDERQKLLFLCGAGQTGKSTFARWVGDRALARSASTGSPPPVMLSMDPVNRDLAAFFADGAVVSPPVGHNPRQWFEHVLSALENSDRNAVVDFGGGDRVLLDLCLEIPEFHRTLGVLEVCALHFFTPRISDLDLMAALEGAGFQPQATALILNCGSTDNPASDFEQLRAHPAYRSVLERGAVEIWLPKHFAAAAVENRRLGFTAAKGVLNLRDRHRNTDWLAQTEQALAPIASWLV